MNIVSLCCLSIFIVACGTSTLKLSELNFLRKGMSIKSVDSVLSIQDESTFSVKHGRKYLVKAYPTFIEKIATGGRPIGGVGGEVTISLSTKVYLIFTDEELRYWGLLQELRKSEDAEIQEMSRFILTY